MPGPRGTAAVLIADDDSLVRMALRMGIENLGHDVVAVTSTEELMSALSDRAFDLCIMDVLIPGTTLEHRLHLLGSQVPELPVIVMSGYSDQPQAVRERGLRFLRKPISLSDLTAALADVGLRPQAESGSESP